MYKKIYSAIIVVTFILFTACGTTKYITKEVPVEVIKEVPVEVVRTEYINSNTIDSLFIKDSIDRYRSGDTVVIYKEKRVVKYKYKVDTLIIRDTIPIITKVEVPVPIKEESVEVREVNKLRWYQRILIYIGLIALGYIFILLLIKYLRSYGL